MFNVTVKGNVRCNGILSRGAGGMAKRGALLNNSAMSPDNKLKFSDRLKAYLSTDGLRSDVSEIDDPYTFSDSEIKPNVPRRCAKVKVESVVKSDSGKTMSRLQAQIARNKVKVKHNRSDLDLKLEKIEKTTHSIIGLVNNVHNSNTTPSRRLPSGKPLPAHLRARRASRPRSSAALESTPRVPVQISRSPLVNVDSDDDLSVFQRHWFSKDLELLRVEEGPREARLELTRSELKRQLLQMRRSRVGLRHSQPSSLSALQTFISEMSRSFSHRRKSRTASGLMARRPCAKDTCVRPALPCTRHCALHIMDNAEQVLFEHCTAKFADNTQCSVPVFDIQHELPLCVEHARKRDNYNKMCQETKPKKPRRKIKPSAMIRPQKRNKKRKRPQKGSEMLPTTTDISELNVCETSSACESSEEVALGTEFVTGKTENHLGDQDVVAQVLALQDEVPSDLVTQASRLLEETDFTTVLNQLPADEFNDLFAVARNGEYEPSREETEELERALEAVDEDVKSLEKLSQTQGILDSLLDENTLVETLVQIPDVFHQNGFEGHGAEGLQAHAPS